MSTDANPNAEFIRLLKEHRAANERGDVQAMEKLSIQLMAIAADEAVKNPSKELLLCQEATEHANAARWEQAEAVYRRMLALAEAEGHQAKIFKARNDIAGLQLIRGMTDAAIQEAQAALEAARKSKVSIVVPVALGDLCGII